MKRQLIIILALCLSSFCASAQWYLFPGSPQSKGDTVAAVSSTVDAAADPLAAEPVDEFVLDIPKTIKVALALPLGSTKQVPSANFYDFYCGAMLAARNLGRQGTSLSINVFDTTDGVTPLTSAALDDADVIIGPVSVQDIQKAFRLCDSTGVVISPLEPKASVLVDTCRLVQVPCAQEVLVDELVDWIKVDMESFDQLVLVKEPGLAPTASQTMLIEKLAASGLNYTAMPSVSSMRFNVMGKTRFICVSDNDSFLLSTVRDISILGQKNPDVVFYTTSRVRSLENLEPTALYDAGTRMVSSYHVDYADGEVRRFILAYRALFANEPGQFAFHGYDTFNFFVNACATYGRQWYKKLPELSGSGLQTDFKFAGSEDLEGWANKAVRHVVYNHDLSMSLQ